MFLNGNVVFRKCTYYIWYNIKVQAYNYKLHGSTSLRIIYYEVSAGSVIYFSLLSNLPKVRDHSSH